jgi:hypothetical protein
MQVMCEGGMVGGAAQGTYCCARQFVPMRCGGVLCRSPHVFLDVCGTHEKHWVKVQCNGMALDIAVICAGANTIGAAMVKG